MKTTIFNEDDNSELVALFGPRASLVYRTMSQRQSFSEGIKDIVATVDEFYRWAEQEKQIKYLNPEEYADFRKRQGVNSDE